MTCRCGRPLMMNLKTGKYWTRCAPCRAVHAKTPGQQSPTRRLARAERKV